MKTKTIGLTLALSVAAAAMCFANNPTLGTWKLNESKSTFGDGAGKTMLVVWQRTGHQNKCTVDGLSAEIFVRRKIDSGVNELLGDRFGCDASGGKRHACPYNARGSACRLYTKTAGHFRVRPLSVLFECVAYALS